MGTAQAPLLAQGQQGMSLQDVPTTDLVTELLNRYYEGFFIGTTPPPNNNSDNHPHNHPHSVSVNGRALQGKPVIDINSKFERDTGMRSILVDVLTTLLHKLKSQTNQLQYGSCTDTTR
jgi:hypothetical protein